MVLTSDVEFQQQLKRRANYFAAAVLLIAVLVLTGWQFNIKCLIHPMPKLAAMNPLTAVAFLLFAISFYLLTSKNTSKQKQVTGKALAIVVSLIGLVRLLEVFFKVDSKMDSSLYHAKIFSESTDAFYAHMSPVAALCFILSGISLLMLNFETRKQNMPAQYLALVIAYFGVASFLGYIFTIKSFYGDLRYVTMAIHTGISFILLSLAFLFATSEKGLMRELTKPYAASIVARRLIPFTILVPAVFGLIRLYMELNGILTYEAGITFIIMCLIISALAFISYNTRMLNKRDFERKAAEQELSKTNTFLSAVHEKLKQVNAELEQSVNENKANAEMFSSLFYKSPVMKAITEVGAATYFDVNHAFAEHMELTREEMIGKTSVELDLIVYPDEREDILKKQREEGLLRNTENKIKLKSGKLIWVSSSTNKIKLNGRDYFMTATVDITERKLAEENLLHLSQELEQKVIERTEALTKSELRLRKILENNYEVILLGDESFIPFYRSPAAERITGRTNEERIKLGVGVDIAHPDDAEQLRKVMKEVTQNPGKNVPATFRQKHKDGHYIWFEGFITNMLHDPSINAIIGNYRDVTERKLYEQKLELSEQRFRNLLENNYEDITVSDKNFVPFYRSPSAERITGYTTEERKQAGGGYDCTHPDDMAKVKAAMKEVLATGGKVVPVAFRTKHKEGHYIWMEGFFMNMLHDKSVGGIVANFRDATVRRTYEQMLEQNEEKFRKLLENNYELISLADENLIPFYRNAAANNVCGWTLEESIAARGNYDHVHPDDLEKVNKDLKEVIETRGKAIPVSFRSRHKDGHYLLMEGFMMNMLHDKALNGILTNLRDVTVRKKYELELGESEKKYRNLFENNPMPMWISDDASMKIIDVNEAAIRHYGYSHKEFLSKTGKDLRPAEDKDSFIKSYNSPLKGFEKRGIWRHLKKDGTIIRVEIILHPLNYEGKPARLILAHDVTERVMAEEEINNLTKELRDLLDHQQISREAERKYIAREIHDELGQRLTAMKIDVSMMRKKVVAVNSGSKQDSRLPLPSAAATPDPVLLDELNAVISQIDQSIESVKRIATDLRPEILDHHGIIEAVKWQAEQFENITGVKCKLHCHTEEMKLESELSTAVYRTVQEALTNIARHAHATSVNISIERDAEKLLIEIKDNGKGINEKEIKSMKSLGLIGIRERAHLLNGTFSITGKQGKGTVVSVTIPLLSEKVILNK